MQSVACGGADCDDANAGRFPGNPEVCDVGDADEDCDPRTFGFRDADLDGEADALCCNVDGSGDRACGTDCDDARPGVNTSAPEVCNGRDDDCDSFMDEGVLLSFYADADEDGYGAGAPVYACSPPSDHVALNTDCNDAAPTAHPGSTEACEGVLDEDCDNSVDEGCSCEMGMMRACGMDEGACSIGEQTCIAGAWAGCNGSGPSPETCNGVDDNCDGDTDEGLTVDGCYRDMDADGYGTGTSTTRCADLSRPSVGNCPAGYTNQGVPVDCDDTVGTRNPGGVEVCNGADDNCNTVVDDVPGAGGSCAVGMGICESPGAFSCVGVTLTCVGTAGTGSTEVCNGFDDDCDGSTDEALTVPSCRTDADADGFGVGAPASRCLDSSRPGFGFCPAGYTNSAVLDCNDANAAVRPTALETCNLVDDDCDGVPDDGVQLPFYADADGDTWGAGMPVQACTAPAGHVARNGDCNDTLGAVHPGATEVCDGAVDHDCDTLLDDGCTCTDGAMQPCGTDEGLCTVGSQTCTGGTWGACSGTPPAAEICDGLDQDCDGAPDDGVASAFYPDSDDDGFGAGVAVLACSAPSGHVGNTLDCDDARETVHPGAAEICNGLDDNCEGTFDESCTCEMGTTQACGTNVGACTFGTQSCTGTGWTPCSGVAPATEVCNGLDDDCDGEPDEFPIDLTSLTATCGALAPSFDPLATAYTVVAGLASTNCQLTPSVACASSTTILVDGVEVPSAVMSAPIPLDIGWNPVSIEVSRGGSSRTYSVDIHRGWRVASTITLNQSSGTKLYGVAMAVDELHAASGYCHFLGTIGYAYAQVASNWAWRATTAVSGTQLFSTAVSGAGEWTLFSSGEQVRALSASGDSHELVGTARPTDLIAVSANAPVAVLGVRGNASAQIYRESAGVWGLAGTLTVPTWSLSLSADGAVVAFGGDNIVRMWRDNSGTWTQAASFTPIVLGANDGFGDAVSVSSDVSRIVVGAPREDSSAVSVNGDATNNAATDAGAAYVFERDSMDPNLWVQTAYLKAWNAGAGDNFGASVSISADGQWLAVGAPGEDSAGVVPDSDPFNDGRGGAGAVYVFSLVGGVWTPAGFIKTVGFSLGNAVSMGGTGTWLAVRSSHDAYLLTRE
ncbi:MAG: cadherin-like beta sandwich domain-containing protein [Deltaproteobacteria bacterium]|nr:cadherin-like beta sandwich domain-containing protein [Deltaproteobacteria bacterium]